MKIYKEYYPNGSEDELIEIQEVVYLLACAVMQHVYGPKWMGDFEEFNPEEK